jgi:hypothetical protein
MCDQRPLSPYAGDSGASICSIERGRLEELSLQTQKHLKIKRKKHCTEQEGDDNNRGAKRIHSGDEFDDGDVVMCCDDEGNVSDCVMVDSEEEDMLHKTSVPDSGNIGSQAQEVDIDGLQVPQR